MSEEPIGYKKPPRHTRYKKGQSGNPGGRKKGSRNLTTILEELMQCPVELSERGRPRKVPLIEALILQQAQCGLKGDWKAIDSLLDRYERVARAEAAPAGDLAEEDNQMLEDHLGRLSGSTMVREDSDK